MKWQNVFSVSLIVCLLTISLSGLAQAESLPPQVGIEPSSAVAPKGYVPISTQRSVKAVANGADILLIQTALPWNSDANTQVLDSLGYTYDIVDMGNIGTVDMFSYPVVLIVNDQVQAFYDQYAAQVTTFEAYVSSGGVLVFFAAGAGWAGGVLTSPLPVGVTWVDGYDPTNHIEDSAHAIVTGILSGGNVEWGGPLTNNDLTGNYCSHGYFSNVPADAHVILASDIWNEPTLMEYSFGGGKVIASTLTWEAYWAWYPGKGGSFAKKALDDVFLYAFSGGTTPTDDIQLDLRVEDAPDSVTVDKSPGSYVDIVARVSGGKAYTPTVTLQVPSDMFGLPTTAFTRDLPNNEGGQSVQYENLGNGNYRIGTTLKALDAYQSDFYKEIVWRFQIPQGTSPQNNIELRATVAVPGLAIAHPTDRAKLDIIDWGTSIVITNRQLLFDKYGTNGNWREVSLLLEEVYKSLYFRWGEVFYVDYYGIEWNQGTDESAANTVADDVDDLLETWYTQLTGERDGISLEPTFLVIVGGDETIPFYRMDDDDYHSWPRNCPNQNVTCEEDIGPNNTQDPVLNAYEDNYFLSDNIYADIDGGKSDWEKGKLELAMGRIVGATAGDMRNLISNGNLETKPLTDAVLMSLQGSQTPDMESALNAKNVDIYGLNSPDMVDNNNWTRQQFLDAWQREYQLIYYGGHGKYHAFPGPGGWNNDVWMWQLPQGHIGENHPLLVADACNLGVPTDQDGGTWAPSTNDAVMYKLANLGMAGMVASTGLSSYDPGGGTAYGEEFVNGYIDELIADGAYSTYSDWFGQAFLDAKRNYAHGWTWDKSDKKTMLEYVYYGLPWTFMETPDNPTALAALESKGYDISYALPQTIGISSYSKVLTTTVSTYQFTPVDGFELLEIPGAEYLYTYQEPVLPYVLTILNLPSGATVSSVQIIGEHSVALGQHNIPAADPANMYHPTTGYTSTMSVSGIYPATRYSYEVNSYTDRTEVRIAIAPAALNVETQAVTLYDATVLQVNYDAAQPVLVHGLDFAPEYRGNEAIDATAIVENVGATAKTLTAILNIYDAAGVLTGTLTISSFAVNAGEDYELPLSWTGSLPHGGYNATLTVYEAGSRLASAPGSFSVSAGSIRAFDAPSGIKMGGYGNFSLTFANYRSSAVNVIADIFVYDRNGIQVAKLLQRNFWVSARSEGTTNWSWTPENLGMGSYTVEAVVTVDGQVHTSSSQHLSVMGEHVVYLPIVLRSQQ
ncbi:MAG: hypothetical protein JXA33_20700 [Anaerolineae bacterium]|nr:hypothetical protein [Anaerolineae bacterium]